MQDDRYIHSLSEIQGTLKPIPRSSWKDNINNKIKATKLVEYEFAFFTSDDKYVGLRNNLSLFRLGGWDK